LPKGELANTFRHPPETVPAGLASPATQGLTSDPVSWPGPDVAVEPIDVAVAAVFGVCAAGAEDALDAAARTGASG